jgi:hypothetical protein
MLDVLGRPARDTGWFPGRLPAGTDMVRVRLLAWTIGTNFKDAQAG